jgi:hypothetical protein
MSIINKFLEKCSVAQWGIGLAKGKIDEVIREKRLDLNFTWLPQNNKLHFIADPFIFKNKEGGINILYEDFSIEKDGKIILTTVDNNFEPIFKKEILDTGSHLSYPFVFKENGLTYIIPESHQRGIVAIYEYDFENNILINEKILIDLPLLDSTILKYKNKYWIFASLGDGLFDNSKLYIYHSESLFGKYKPHAQNPVRHHLNATRPAGNFIQVDGDLFRPSQNCAENYGKSITINKVLRLSETEFEEEHYFDIKADKKCSFNAGLHTINVVDDVITIDGKRMHFMPFTKTRLFIKKRFRAL